eukprot:g46563.t1
MMKGMDAYGCDANHAGYFVFDGVKLLECFWICIQASGIGSCSMKGKGFGEYLQKFEVQEASALFEMDAKLQTLWSGHCIKNEESYLDFLYQEADAPLKVSRRYKLDEQVDDGVMVQGATMDVVEIGDDT